MIKLWKAPEMCLILLIELFSWGEPQEKNQVDYAESLYMVEEDTKMFISEF